MSGAPARPLIQMGGSSARRVISNTAVLKLCTPHHTEFLRKTRHPKLKRTLTARALGDHIPFTQQLPAPRCLLRPPIAYLGAMNSGTAPLGNLAGEQLAQKIATARGPPWSRPQAQ